MQRLCTQCSGSFEITDDDLEFYEKISPVFAGKKYAIPPPLQCPDCRFQRRLVWRREHALKTRNCDKCEKRIISIHTKDALYPVYCLPCWWGDGFDALEFGKQFDPNRSFNNQIKELMQAVPQITMMNDNGVGSENCEYCQDFAFGKNCYLVTGAWELQDCYYCDCNCLKSRHLFDCYGVHFSELTYESLSSQHLYTCVGLSHSDNSYDCWFGMDLKGCKDCIGCFGLRQKRFCIFNEQYTEENYRKKLSSLHLSTRQGFEAFRRQYETWILRFPRRCVHLINCEDCIGDDLFNCKDVYMGFQLDGAEYCKFTFHGDTPKNSYDVNQTGRPEWCYEGATPDNSYMTHFTAWCWKDKYVLYSDNCHNCEHCFGCVSLKRKKYCILNIQYTKEEYESLVVKIIERMISDGEWGEFFPMSMSPYCYNETAAQEYFPLTKEVAEARHLQWREHDSRESTVQTFTIPEAIEDVSDEVVDHVFSCVQCNHNFKILKQELMFYRDLGIPIPHSCYECRWAQRVQHRNPRTLWNRDCGKCQKPIATSYSPERPEVVVCEQCYLKEVY